jgi:hypothetical protein
MTVSNPPLKGVLDILNRLPKILIKLARLRSSVLGDRDVRKVIVVDL